jgi:hypothetical protein
VKARGANFTSVTQLGSTAAELSPADLRSYAALAKANARANMQRTGDLDAASRKFANPNYAWSSTNKDDARAVEAVVAVQGATLTAALQVFNSTGILATAGLKALRAGLESKDHGISSEAAATLGGILRHNPKVFLGMDGADRPERVGVLFNHYLNFGIDSADAARRAVEETTPGYRSKLSMRGLPISVLRDYWRGKGAPEGMFPGAKFHDEASKALAGDAYFELFRNEVEKGTDPEAAWALAGEKFRQMFGVSAGGTITAYPIELTYDPIDGGHDYVFQDAMRSVRELEGRKDNPSKIVFQTVLGVTDSDYQSRQPARYRLYYAYSRNGHLIWEVAPHFWQADPNAASRANEASLRKAKAARTALLDGPVVPTFIPYL